MRRERNVAKAAVLALIVAVAALSAGAAVTEGRTNAGHRYLVGGIGIEESDAMRAQAPAFSLQLLTAARSGAYVAGAHVRIAGAGNEAILDSTIEGPWLLVDLPAGRYSVRATHSGQTVERRVTIATGKAERVVMHFDVPVDVAPPADTLGVQRSTLPR